MSHEDHETRFLLALEELNTESEKRGYPQKAIKCNNYGLFINFAGIEVNYSLYSLDDDLEGYFTQQAEKHECYLRVLQIHKLQSKRELQKFSGAFYTFLQRISKPSKKDLEETIERGMVKVAFDKVLKEGALLGKYFFEDYVGDTGNLEPIKEKLINLNQEIYGHAKDLEAIDKERLQYFKNKNLEWYAQQG